MIVYDASELLIGSLNSGDAYGGLCLNNPGDAAGIIMDPAFATEGVIWYGGGTVVTVDPKPSLAQIWINAINDLQVAVGWGEKTSAVARPHSFQSWSRKTR